MKLRYGKKKQRIKGKAYVQFYLSLCNLSDNHSSNVFDKLVMLAVMLPQGSATVACLCRLVVPHLHASLLSPTCTQDLQNCAKLVSCLCSLMKHQESTDRCLTRLSVCLPFSIITNLSQSVYGHAHCIFFAREY